MQPHFSLQTAMTVKELALPQRSPKPRRRGITSMIDFGPDSFGFVESVTVLSMVVVGGIGSVTGVIVAAALLSVLPAWFQFIGDYKLLVYGGLLFLMMRYSPGGMAALVSRFFSPVGKAGKGGRS